MLGKGLCDRCSVANEDVDATDARCANERPNPAPEYMLLLSGMGCEALVADPSFAMEKEL